MYIHLAMLSMMCQLLVRSNPVRSRLQRVTDRVKSQDELAINMVWPPLLFLKLQQIHDARHYIISFALVIGCQ